jgi:hypothetical protein
VTQGPRGGWSGAPWGSPGGRESYPGPPGGTPGGPPWGSWQPPGHLRGPERGDYLLIGGGGLLLALSTLLPWISVAFIGSLSLFSLTTAAKSVVFLPWAMVVAGLALGTMAFMGSRITLLSRVAGIVVVAVTVLAGFGDLIVLIRAVDDSYGFARLDGGPFLAIAALVLLTVGVVRVHVRYGVGSSPASWHRGRPAAPPPGRVSAPVPLDPSPGWKQDPWGLPGRLRWWDGSGWTRATR